MPQELADLQIPLIVDDRPLLVGCLEYVVYLQSPTPGQVRDFWFRSAEALGTLLRCVRSDSRKRLPPALEDVGEMLHRWLREARPGQSLMVEASGVSRGVTDASVALHVTAPAQTTRSQDEERAYRKQIYEVGRSVFAPPISALRVTLPLDHALCDPGRFRDWFKGFACIREGGYSGGHAGFAINLDDAISRDAPRRIMLSQAANLLARHPGLDWEYPGAVLRKLLRYRPDTVDFVPQVKRVNWMTLVPLATVEELERLGDGPALARLRVSDDRNQAVVEDLAGGIAIFAQPAPSLGDRLCHDPLPAYCSVGSVLQRVTMPVHPPLGGALDGPFVDAWFKAFQRLPLEA